MMNRRGFELSFGWIFSIMVGAVIIILAIYGATKLVKQEREVQDTEIGQQLGTLLNPLETSLESGSRPGNISFPQQSRVYNKCFDSGEFGMQELSVATKSEIGEDWADPGLPVKAANKYVFSPSVMEGKDFMVFVKPLNMPFKVGDLIMMWSEEYCFVGPPVEIEEEITSLQLESSRIKKSGSISGCSRSSEKVCFNSRESACDVLVDTNLKKVTKDRVSVYYEGPFIYGAIISDPGIYECQVSRMTKRAEEMAELYSAKSMLISTRSSGCSSVLGIDLNQYSLAAKNATSRDLEGLWMMAQQLERVNENLNCPLWKEEME